MARTRGGNVAAQVAGQERPAASARAHRGRSVAEDIPTGSGVAPMVEEAPTIVATGGRLLSLFLGARRIYPYFINL